MKKVACDIGALPICHRQLFIFLMLRRNIKILLSAKSSYIIIMIGPSSDFGSQPYFGYL